MGRSPSVLSDSTNKRLSLELLSSFPGGSKMQANYMISENPLSLDRIRSILTRLEDTIIFSLIERAQFAHNPKIYELGAFREQLGGDSWLVWFLHETECFHAKARRYTSPDEYPFTTNLPAPILPSLKYPKILYPNDVNANASILSFYTRYIVPRITRSATLALAKMKRAKGITGDEEYEDDGNYGSAATIDIEVLQAISKRVHYGKFVSESKFIEDPAAFIPHIQTRNQDALAGLITKPEVEHKLLQRLRKKASLYAQDFASDGEPQPLCNGTNGKIDVEGVVELYENYIIPLTKEVEVSSSTGHTLIPDESTLTEPMTCSSEGRSSTCYSDWTTCPRRRSTSWRNRDAQSAFWAFIHTPLPSLRTRPRGVLELPTANYVTRDRLNYSTYTVGRSVISLIHGMHV
ncbi:hypothetical protein EW146_g1915 [Bondarzewia mesenterica]|uniref:Chorismate mutase n=1 Tax=Bondarzewia mesenterica TaxID=1095465 RepID=A0A4S4M4K3_9AGAM|nr:hypothetical protein EW146_g1915 [Bondarzewia mesenterica]